MKLYVILPIYNIEVEKEVINTEIINEYKLITNEIFFNDYEKEITSNKDTDIMYNFLKADILIPQPGMLDIRPLAKYILIRECEVGEEYVYNKEIFKNFVNEEVDKINKFILLLRLIQKGQCRINSLYFFSIKDKASSLTDFSTNIGNMYNYNETLCETKYFLSKKIVSKLNQEYLIVQLYSKDILIPITYFMQYYNTSDVYDRIIKLAIALESSVLAGIKEELSYKLQIRTSAFLKRDCKNILKLFYRLRSWIVHNGEIDKKSFKDIKRIIGDEQCSDTEVLFVFITDYIEPIVRDILYKSFEAFAKDETIKSYRDLFSSVDNEIIEKITT